MRRMQLVAVVMMGLMAVMLGGCQALQAPPPDDVLHQKAVDLVHGVSEAAHELQAAAHASTQPSTLPDGTVIPPAISPASTRGQKVIEKIDTAAAAVDTANTALSNTGNPGTLLQTIAPLTGQAAPWVFLGGTILGWLSDRRKKNAANDALTSAVGAFQSATAQGQISVAPAAVNTVNNLVTAHPGTDALVDAVSDAAKTPRI